VKYPDTYITVEGHTDSTGTTKYNQMLSERRADAVRDQLLRTASRIEGQRQGYGNPLPSPTTPLRKGGSRIGGSARDPAEREAEGTAGLSR